MKKSVKNAIAQRMGKQELCCAECGTKEHMKAGHKCCTDCEKKKSKED